MVGTVSAARLAKNLYYTQNLQSNRRGEARLCAFDLLWCDGENLCYAPLIERKLKLKSLLSGFSDRLFYCDHIEQRGESLFRAACEHDLEGIVAKRKYDSYRAEHTTWLKIRNQHYSQWAGREELFEHERRADPDLQGWAVCTEACDTDVRLGFSNDHSSASDSNRCGHLLGYFGTRISQSRLMGRPSLAAAVQ
jgi:hypothetical protein